MDKTWDECTPEEQDGINRFLEDVYYIGTCPPLGTETHKRMNRANKKQKRRDKQRNNKKFRGGK